MLKKKRSKRLQKFILLGISMASAIILVLPLKKTIVNADTKVNINIGGGSKDDDDKDKNQDNNHTRVVLAPLCDNVTQTIDLEVVDEDDKDWVISTAWDAGKGYPKSGSTLANLEPTDTPAPTAQTAKDLADDAKQGVAETALGPKNYDGSPATTPPPTPTPTPLTDKNGNKNVSKAASQQTSVYGYATNIDYVYTGYPVYAGDEFTQYYYLVFPGQSYSNEEGITAVDDALAQNVAEKMTNSFSQMTDLIEAQSSSEFKIKDFTKFIRNYMEESDDPKDHGKVVAGDGEYEKGLTVAWKPLSDVTDKDLENVQMENFNATLDPKQYTKDRGIDKGTSINNFMLFTVTNSEGSVRGDIIQFSVPKGYSKGQYASDEWDKNDSAKRIAYITLPGIATYANHMANNGKYTGETTVDYFYPDQNAITKQFGSFLSTILQALYKVLGVEDIVKLIFARGKSAGYYEGIMPYSSMRAMRMFYWIFLVIALFVLFEAIYVTVIKRTMADISPAIRADFKNDVLRLLLVLVLELFFVSAFSLLCRGNMFIVDLFSSLVASNANTFQLGVYSIGFIIVTFITLALTVTVNIQFLIRRLTIGICYMIAPVAIATLAYDDKRNIFNVWLKALISNIYVQAFDAIVLAMLFAIANGVRSSLMRICLIYAIIPLSSWFKEDLCGLRDGSSAISDAVKNEHEKYKQRVGAMATSAINVTGAALAASGAKKALPLGLGGKNPQLTGGAGKGGGGSLTVTDNDGGGGSGNDDNNFSDELDSPKDSLRDSKTNEQKKHETFRNSLGIAGKAVGHAATTAAIYGFAVGAEGIGIHTGPLTDRMLGGYIGRGFMSQGKFDEMQMNAAARQTLVRKGYNGELKKGWSYNENGKTKFTTNQNELKGKSNIQDAYAATVRPGMIDDKTWANMKDQNVAQYEAGNQHLVDGANGEQMVVASADNPDIMDIGKAAAQIDNSRNNLENMRAAGVDTNVPMEQVIMATDKSGRLAVKGNGTEFEKTLNKFDMDNSKEVSIPAFKAFNSDNISEQNSMLNDLNNNALVKNKGLKYDKAILEHDKNGKVSNIYREGDAQFEAKSQQLKKNDNLSYGALLNSAVTSNVPSDINGTFGNSKQHVFSEYADPDNHDQELTNLNNSQEAHNAKVIYKDAIAKKTSDDGYGEVYVKGTTGYNEHYNDENFVQGALAQASPAVVDINSHDSASVNSSFIPLSDDQDGQAVATDMTNAAVELGNSDIAYSEAIAQVDNFGQTTNIVGYGTPEYTDAYQNMQDDPTHYIHGIMKGTQVESISANDTAAQTGAYGTTGTGSEVHMFNEVRMNTDFDSHNITNNGYESTGVVKSFNNGVNGAVGMKQDKATGHAHMYYKVGDGVPNAYAASAKGMKIKD